MDAVTNKDDLVAALRRLAFGKANDAVRLVFVGEDALSSLKRLDLSLVSEIKRGANGAIEVKLINRLEVFELLARLLQETDHPDDVSAAKALFKALDEAASRLGKSEEIKKSKAGEMKK